MDNSGLTRTQSKRNLKNATKEYSSLSFLEDIEIARSSRTSVFSYSSLFDVDINDKLNRFGNVKIETTDFTISQPTESHVIAPLIHTLASQSQKNILENDYNVVPFAIQTISLERIFIDKIFALENRILRNEFEEASKHAYDICHLLRLDRIKALLTNSTYLMQIIDIQMKEELLRINSNIKCVHPSKFEFHSILNVEDKFLSAFNSMQNVYVFDKKDKLDFNSVLETIKAIVEVFSWIVKISKSHETER